MSSLHRERSFKVSREDQRCNLSREAKILCAKMLVDVSLDKSSQEQHFLLHQRFNYLSSKVQINMAEGLSSCLRRQQGHWQAFLSKSGNLLTFSLSSMSVFDSHGALLSSRTFWDSEYFFQILVDCKVDPDRAKKAAEMWKNIESAKQVTESLRFGVLNLSWFLSTVTKSSTSRNSDSIEIVAQNAFRAAIISSSKVAGCPLSPTGASLLHSDEYSAFVVPSDLKFESFALHPPPSVLSLAAPSSSP